MTAVCVVGAGIVGCATAYHLASVGYHVHLLDAAPEAGTGTSYANGAQLSYSYVEPFASPATLRALPGMLMSSDSPVKFRLAADWRQWAWGISFLRACRTGKARNATAHLLELANLSRLTLNQWMHREQWAVSFVQNGKLVLCPDLETLRRQESQVKLQAALGCTQEVLAPHECVRREPALAETIGSFAGGVWTADECVADPYLLCGELVRATRRMGGTVSFNTRVTSFVREGSRFVAARTDAGDVPAQAFVLAAGPAASSLAATFGLYLPIHPIKGYSITVPFKPGARSRPSASVTDLGRKTVFAPLNGHLRVAAMAEVGARDVEVPPQRISTMVNSVEAVYPGLCHLADPKVWAGLRPATPDSLPIIGRVKSTNMFVNAGHGALGLTLAAGSAVRIAADISRHA